VACAQQKVHAGFNIINDQVIILGADNTLEPVSGCSIDSSVRFMQSLNAELDDADLFNRLRGLMVTNDGYVSVSGNTPELSEDTMFLNIWAATKKHLMQQCTYLYTTHGIVVLLSQ
jgi:hypothetical protein